MSNERRHLRYIITSALLVGPALGCGGPEPESNTVSPVETTETETTETTATDENVVPNVNTQFDREPPPEIIDQPTANPVAPDPDPPPMPEEEPETNVGREDF